VITARAEVGRVEERHVDAAVIVRDRGDGDERLVEGPRDHLRRRPRRAAVVRDGVVDLRRNKRAFLPLPEIAVRAEGIPVYPRGDVLLVEDVTDAGENAAPVRDHLLGPRLALV